MQAPPINQPQLQQLLQWIDTFSFSRPKRNLPRDFSDGVLMSQLLYIYFPQYINLHNYSATSSSSAKYINWKTLIEKCFKKINLNICKVDVENIINSKQGTIERVLYQVYKHLKEYLKNVNNTNNTNQSSQKKNNKNHITKSEYIIQQYNHNSHSSDSQNYNNHNQNQQSLNKNKNNNNNFSTLSPNKSNLNYIKQLSCKLVQKDELILQMKDTILILQQKLKRMEQLNQLKDNKISQLVQKLETDVD